VRKAAWARVVIDAMEAAVMGVRQPGQALEADELQCVWLDVARMGEGLRGIKRRAIIKTACIVHGTPRLCIDPHFPCCGKV